MTENFLPALAFAALTLGVLHTLAPDHWLPFAAVGRARRWSVRRTGAVTLLAGLGHVTVSAILGLSALRFGIAVLERWGDRLTSLAGLLLLAFGAGYGIWGLYRATHRRLPGLGGAGEAATPGLSSRGTVTSLFVLFALDPCVPLIPLVVAAAALGPVAAVTVIAVYAAATLSTMTLLAVTARTGAGVLRAPWLDRWGHAAAGALILLVGVAVGLVGI